jgi:hypothetical protein
VEYWGTFQDLRSRTMLFVEKVVKTEFVTAVVATGKATTYAHDAQSFCRFCFTFAPASE